MRSQKFITPEKLKIKIKNCQPQTAKWKSCATLACFFLLFSSSINAQRTVAFLTPDENKRSQLLAEKLQSEFSAGFRLIDSSLAAAAFLLNKTENPLNLKIEQARNIGAAIGCNYFLLIKADLLRRSAFKREEFYEAYSVVYLISAKTGKLVLWNLEEFDDDVPSKAEKKLLDSTLKLTKQISIKIEENEQQEIKPLGQKDIEEIPLENTPEAKNFRPPLPYRRISPKYTEIAARFDVKATVDVSVDVAADGKILNLEIVRWAGYGLDESVTEAVQKMNWRPAERNKNTLPMRILLRYNFKDTNDEEK